jgi:hypothetical protein
VETRDGTTGPLSQQRDARIVQVERCGRELVMTSRTVDGPQGGTVLRVLMSDQGHVRQVDAAGGAIGTAQGQAELAALRRAVQAANLSFPDRGVRSGELVSSTFIPASVIAPGDQGTLSAEQRLIGATVYQGRRAYVLEETSGALGGGPSRTTSRGYLVIDAATGFTLQSETLRDMEGQSADGRRSILIQRRIVVYASIDD